MIVCAASIHPCVCSGKYSSRCLVRWYAVSFSFKRLSSPVLHLSAFYCGQSPALLKRVPTIGCAQAVNFSIGIVIFHDIHHGYLCLIVVLKCNAWAKYAIPRFPSWPLSNLRKIEVDIDINGYCVTEIFVSGWFLKNAPAQDMTEFYIDDNYFEIQLYAMFLEKAINLKRVSKELLF